MYRKVIFFFSNLNSQKRGGTKSETFLLLLKIRKSKKFIISNFVFTAIHFQKDYAKTGKIKDHGFLFEREEKKIGADLRQTPIN